ncbi:unnamed protein product, partial [Cuscuta epithymum]
MPYALWTEAKTKRMKPASSSSTFAMTDPSIRPKGPPAGQGGTARAHAMSSAPGSSSGPSFGANQAATIPGSGTGSGTAPSGETNVLNELTREQVQALLNLINVAPTSCDRMPGTFTSLPWIIDTGASHHVTGDLSCLIDCVRINACPIGLPDGRTVTAEVEGRVPLNKNLVLDHVLYVPGLNCHLISVSQRIDKSDCIVVFTNLFCAIHDLHSRNLIGAGERRDALYYFWGIPALNSVHASGLSDFELWHRRLGHPSDRVIRLLPHFVTSSSVKKLNKACEVCPQAKQVRDSFTINSFRASRILELVHCDLWGPYKTPSTCDAIYFLTLVDDFSRAVWVYLLRDKKEVFRFFLSFITMVEKQYEVSVKTICSDNGTE